MKWDLGIKEGNPCMYLRDEYDDFIIAVILQEKDEFHIYVDYLYIGTYKNLNIAMNKVKEYCKERF